jgi:hypothetical protein
VKDQHEKIAGYRDLTQAEIDLMNSLKDMEREVGLDLAVIAKNLPNLGGDDVLDARRWLSLARTHLETGFMYAIKAVARPTNGLGRDRGQ